MDAPGVAVLAPAARPGRAPPRDLHARRVAERANRLSDAPDREPGRRLGLLHRLLAVGDAVAVGNPRQRLRALGAGHLDQRRLVREPPQEPDQVVLVLGQFVDVVRRDSRRLVALDQPSELPERHDVAVDPCLALRPVGRVEDDQRERRRRPPHVAALDVHPEDRRVERARPGVHRRELDRDG